MARLWTDGAELKSTGAIEHSDTGTAPAISTSPTNEGGPASYRLHPAAASLWFGQQFKAADSSTQAWMRVYLYVATLPGVETEFAGLWTTGGARQAYLSIDASGIVRMRDSAGTQKGSNSSALSTGTWYRVEFTTTASATVAVMEARIDGFAFATASNGNVGNYSRFLLGTPAGAGSYDIYMDDIAVNDSAAGGDQTSWPSAGAYRHMHPNADGDNHAWLKLGGGAGDANNFNQINEVTPDDVTTYLKRTSTGTKIDDYNVESSASAGIPSGSRIRFVAVGARMGSTSTTATGRNYASRVKSQASGTVKTGATAAINVNGWLTHVNAAPRNYQNTAYVDPQAGGDWTTALLDTMQIGITTVTSSANEIRATTVWAGVEYVPVLTLAPDPVTIPLVVPAPTLALSNTVTPTPVTVPLVIPDPVVTLSGGTQTLTPDPVAVPLVVPSPTVALSLAVAPTPVTVPLVVSAPTISLSLAITSSPGTIPIAVPSPTVTLGVLALTPSPVTIPVVVTTPTIAKTYTVAPSPVAIPIATQAPTIAKTLTLTPASLAIPLVTPAPTLTLSLAVAPSPVAVPLVIPTPTVTSLLTISPAPVTIPLVVPAPTVALSNTLAPTPATIPIVVPAPTIALSLALAPTPATIPLVVPIPTVTVSGAPQTLAPDPVTVPLVIPSPSVSTQLTISPSPVTVPMVVPAPAVSLTTIIQPTPVTVPIVIPAPAITASLALAPTPVAIPLLVPTPTVTVAGGTQTIAPDPVTIPILVPVPTVSQPVPPVPPIIVVGGGWRPSRQQPQRTELPRWQPPRTILRPEPVRVTIEVLTPARVEIDWLSVARREDEELMTMGVL